MLQYLSMLTAYLIVITGFVVWVTGDWRKLKVKYAAVVVSTIASVWLLLANHFMGAAPMACLHDGATCRNIFIYAILRNCALILFHIAVGRDAIRLKTRDRRCT